MEFKKFAKKLKNIIGGKSNTQVFTKTIFETLMNESGPELLKGTSPNTFKAYYNGNTSISKIAPLVLANLSDEDEFSAYLDGFGASTSQLLADEFVDEIPDINAVNASSKIYDLFLLILKEASVKKKSTPKSAKKTTDKTPHDILEEKLLASGQAIAVAWGNAVSGLVSESDSNKFELPEENSCNDSPYTENDTLLLQDFTDDYDEIMLNLMSENYGDLLINMEILDRIQTLYENKWKSKAHEFSDASLNSYIFGLLGELNSICGIFDADGGKSTPLLFNQARGRIRNLYVKLHPEKYTSSSPHDVFIDDWNDFE